jgi:hypothetical protein
LYVWFHTPPTRSVRSNAVRVDAVILTHLDRGEPGDTAADHHHLVPGGVRVGVAGAGGGAHVDAVVRENRRARAFARAIRSVRGARDALGGLRARTVAARSEPDADGACRSFAIAAVELPRTLALLELSRRPEVERKGSESA